MILVTAAGGTVGSAAGAAQDASFAGILCPDATLARHKTDPHLQGLSNVLGPRTRPRATRLPRRECRGRGVHFPD